MVDTAAHLVDRVFPQVPVRQWVLSLPHALRYRLAYDASVTSSVLDLFIRTVFGYLRRRARDYGIERSQCGAVTFIQRCGDSLAANVHFHSMVFDGVYAPGRDARPEFFALRPPEDADIAAIVQCLSERIPALLRRRGLDIGESEPEQSDPLVRDNPWLAGLYAASVSNRIAEGPNAGRRAVIGGDRVDPEDSDPRSTARCAAANGFSLHGNVAIPAHDRARLERLFRYAARPSIAAERLEELPDGRLLYRFKRVWRNGATHAIFTPMELLERLAVLVPAPRAHTVRYHGVIAPAAKWRPLVAPGSDCTIDDSLAHTPSPDTAAETGRAASATQPLPPASTVPHRRNYVWSELIRRVFHTDVESCAACGGKMRLISAIFPPTAGRILEHLGLSAKPPPVAPARLEPQHNFPAQWF